MFGDEFGGPIRGGTQNAAPAPEISFRGHDTKRRIMSPLIKSPAKAGLKYAVRKSETVLVAQSRGTLCASVSFDFFKDAMLHYMKSTLSAGM